MRQARQTRFAALESSRKTPTRVQVETKIERFFGGYRPVFPLCTRPFDVGRILDLGANGWCGFGFIPIIARIVASMRRSVSSSL
jgi:hypothetical protein